jgi:hypothetical protein
MPRRKLNLNLSAHEKRELEDYLKEYGSQPRIVKRCRIILMTDEGIALQDIADLLGLSKTTVNAWRQIYLGRRLLAATQMHYARQGIITPEMEFIAIRENQRRENLLPIIASPASRRCARCRHSGNHHPGIRAG